MKFSLDRCSQGIKNENLEYSFDVKINVRYCTHIRRSCYMCHVQLTVLGLRWVGQNTNLPILNYFIIITDISKLGKCDIDHST